MFIFEKYIYIEREREHENDNLVEYLFIYDVLLIYEPQKLNGK